MRAGDFFQKKFGNCRSFVSDGAAICHIMSSVTCRDSVRPLLKKCVLTRRNKVGVLFTAPVTMVLCTARNTKAARNGMQTNEINYG